MQSEKENIYLSPEIHRKKNTYNYNYNSNNNCNSQISDFLKSGSSSKSSPGKYSLFRLPKPFNRVDKWLDSKGI